MVDANDTDTLNENTKAVESNASALDRLNNLYRQGADAVRDWQAKLALGTTSLSQTVHEIAKLGAMKGELDVFSKLIGESGAALNQLGADGVAVGAVFLDILPKNTALFGQMGAAGKKAGFDIAEGFSRAIPMLQKLPMVAGIVPHFQRLFETAAQAQGLELGLIRAAAATGNLSKFTRELDGDFKNLRDASARYTNSINAVAEASGVLPSQLAPFAEVLANIPDALNTTIKSQTEFGNQFNQLNATFKIANALGMDHNEVQQQLDTAWRQLNLRGQGALEIMARIGLAAQDLNLPMDTVRQRVMQTGEAFRMFGNQTNSAINILANVRGALEDSNIGPAAIDQIVGSMTQGIAQMDVAQKAFISGASGGPGGLFGAFEIDYQLRQEGGLERVLDQTMRAMQNQFGGPVVTMEDVMQTPALSGEFLKQISFLKDVAGIAKSDTEAQRILEVMKKGGVGAEELDLAATPEDALRNAIEAGGKVQQSQMNHVINLLTKIEMAQTVASRKALDIARIGADSMQDQQKLVELNKKTAESVALGVEQSERGVTAATEAEALRTEVLPALGAQMSDVQIAFKDQLDQMFGGNIVSGIQKGIREDVEKMDERKLVMQAQQLLPKEQFEDLKNELMLLQPNERQKRLQETVIAERGEMVTAKDIAIAGTRRLLGTETRPTPATEAAPLASAILGPEGIPPAQGAIARRPGVAGAGGIVAEPGETSPEMVFKIQILDQFAREIANEVFTKRINEERSGGAHLGIRKSE